MGPTGEETSTLIFMIIIQLILISHVVTNTHKWHGEDIILDTQYM